MHIRSRDMDLELKYNSNEPEQYVNYTFDYENNYNILILLITKDGNKYGAFISNNILFNNEDYDFKKSDFFSGYTYDNHRLNEIKIKEFYDKYGNYLQNIYYFLVSIKNNNSLISNKDTLVELMGEVVIFEIYKVIATKKQNQII